MRTANLRARAGSAMGTSEVRGWSGALVGARGERASRGGRGVLSRLVAVAEQLPVCRQQRHLRPVGQQPLAGVEDVGDLTGVPRDGGDPDLHTPVQVEVADLRGSYGEAAPELRHDRPDDGALALER